MNVESLVSEWDPLRGGLLPRAWPQAGPVQQRWQVYSITLQKTTWYNHSKGSQ